MELVAWLASDTITGKTYFIDNKEDMIKTSKLERYSIKPLYTHPPVSSMLDDSVSEE